MKIKFQMPKYSFILAGVLFIIIFLYYTVVDPVIVFNFDDWRYFGFFESDPVPRLGRWNITRILPEYMQPASGWFSAFLIYPLVGDYLVSSSITLAFFIASSITVLFIVSYRLFNVLYENKNINMLVSLMMILLCFAIFKGNPESNVHMFYTDQYTLYFFYVLPNILNSIVVLTLFRQMILQKNLSISTNPSLKTGILLAGIYFCIFSMLYSAAILLAFAFSVAAHRFYVFFRQNKKITCKIKDFFMDLTRHYNIVLIIIGGMAIAMVLELQSGRANAADQFDDLYIGSLFSADFLRRIVLSASRFIGWFKSVNKYVFLMIALITSVAAIFYYVKQRNKPCLMVRLAVKCLVALLFLVFFYSLVSAKGGTASTGLIHCIYGIFFYFVLFICLSSIYLLQEIKYSRMFFPFILTVLIMIIFNSTRWPYQTFREKENTEIMYQTISSISEASDLGHTSIVLYVPADFPLPFWAVGRLSWTLYYHNITSPRVEVVGLKYSTDDKLYYVPE